MNNESIDILESEMTTLARRITMLAKENKGDTDRSTYLLLRILADYGDSGVKKLATILQLDVSTVSRQAALLERNQLITKVPNPIDKRSYYYQISAAGKQKLLFYKNKRKDFFVNLLADWSEQELEDFSQLLQKFNETALKAYHQKQSD